MTQMIFYIINSSEKRVGTESDNTIIADFLDEGYIVVTLDYKNSPLAVSPSIDWSIQNIRIKMDEGNLYLNGLKHRRFYDSVRPHMTGFLMQGYAGVVYDYCYAPMGRDDHYGWWAGCELGDKMASLYNTAAVRKLRLMSYENHEKYKFDNDRFGAMGHSKSGIAYVLGSPEP